MAVDALEKDPDHAMLMALAATLEGMFGDFEASCPRVEKLEKLAREINEIVMTAETQRQCGKYKKSIKTYEKAFQISPHYSAWIKQFYTYALLQNGDLEAAKKYAMEQSVQEHFSGGANESFHALLAYIYHKEGDENSAKEYFEKQKNMKNRRTKQMIITNFSSVRSKVFMNDYIKVLQSLGMPDQ